MALPSLWRWGGGRELPVVRRDEPARPFEDFYVEMRRLMDDFWQGLAGSDLALPGAGFWPRVDVEETDAEIRVTAELPGLAEKDFGLSVDRDELVIRGEKRSEHAGEERGFLRHERSWGSFERRIPLPCEVDVEKASARYEKGLLTVTLPKSESARRRTIAIPVRAS